MAEIAIFAYPTFNAPVKGSPSEYCMTFGTETCGYPRVKKLKIYLFVSTEFTQVTDRHTARTA